MDVQKSCSPEGVEHQWQEDIAVQLKEVGMPEQIEANASVGDNVSSRTTCRTTNISFFNRRRSKSGKLWQVASVAKVVCCVAKLSYIKVGLVTRPLALLAGIDRPLG
jgi:hypothetical protein